MTAGTAYVDIALHCPQRFKLMFSGGYLGRDECPQRLLEESTGAYLALLRVARGDEAGDFERGTYRMDLPEFATWALVHGAATLYLDGALSQIEREDDFRALVVRMLERPDIFS